MASGPSDYSSRSESELRGIITTVGALSKACVDKHDGEQLRSFLTKGEATKAILTPRKPEPDHPELRIMPNVEGSRRKRMASEYCVAFSVLIALAWIPHGYMQFVYTYFYAARWQFVGDAWALWWTRISDDVLRFQVVLTAVVAAFWLCWYRGLSFSLGAFNFDPFFRNHRELLVSDYPKIRHNATSPTPSGPHQPSTQDASTNTLAIAHEESAPSGELPRTLRPRSSQDVDNLQDLRARFESIITNLRNAITEEGQSSVDARRTRTYDVATYDVANREVPAVDSPAEDARLVIVDNRQLTLLEKVTENLRHQSRVRLVDHEREVERLKKAAEHYREMIPFLHRQVFNTLGRFWVMVRLYKPSWLKLEESRIRISGLGALQVMKSRGDLHDPRKKRWEPETFGNFAMVFPHTASNAMVWERLHIVVDSLLDEDGQSVIIIVDGQSGSGKSYTMFDKSDSIASSASTALFTGLEALGTGHHVQFQACEVYKGEAYDLGTSSNDVKVNTIDSLSSTSCTDSRTLARVIKTAADRCSRAKTDWNEQSSRGHFFVNISVSSSRAPYGFASSKGDQRPATERMTRNLLLLDMAGRERAGRNEHTDSSRQSERQSINEERQAISEERSEFHRYLSSMLKNSSFFPTQKLGKMLRPLMEHPNKIAYICCVTLTDGVDENEGVLNNAREDIKMAAKLSGAWAGS